MQAWTSDASLTSCNAKAGKATQPSVVKLLVNNPAHVDAVGHMAIHCDRVALPWVLHSRRQLCQNCARVTVQHSNSECKCSSISTTDSLNMQHVNANVYTCCMYTFALYHISIASTGIAAKHNCALGPTMLMLLLLCLILTVVLDITIWSARPTSNIVYNSSMHDSAHATHSACKQSCTYCCAVLCSTLISSGRSTCLVCRCPEAALGEIWRAGLPLGAVATALHQVSALLIIQ